MTARAHPKPMFLGAAAGFRLGLGRLRNRALGLVALLALAVAAVVALVERNHGRIGAADRTLVVVVGLVLPLGSFAVVSLVGGSERLGDGVWPLSRHGLPRRSLVLGLVAVAMVAASLLAVAAVVLSLLLSRGPVAALAADAVTSAWIAALGACAYVAWFALGAGVLRRGHGRWLVLALDFTAGAGSGLVAVAWPRAQLTSLIGGASVLELPQRTSSVLLLGMAVVLTALASLLAGD